MQPLMETVLSYLRQYATALGNHLWKRYATALGNRLWKRYVTACLVTYPVMQPLMEMVCNRFRQPLMETVCNRLSSYLLCYATAYGNGISPPKISCKTL